MTEISEKENPAKQKREKDVFRPYCCMTCDIAFGHAKELFDHHASKTHRLQRAKNQLNSAIEYLQEVLES